MRNDRDDKYEGSEDSEYHFDDSHYESGSEPGAVKQDPETPGITLEKSPKSKRMLISLGVFIVLVVVVYKMVVPSNTKPNLEITRQPAASAQAAMSPTQATMAPMQAAPSNRPEMQAQSAPPSNVMPVQPSPDVAKAQQAAQQAMLQMMQQVSNAAPQPGQPVNSAPSAVNAMQQAANQGPTAMPAQPTQQGMMQPPSSPQQQQNAMMPSTASPVAQQPPGQVMYPPNQQQMQNPAVGNNQGQSMQTINAASSGMSANTNNIEMAAVAEANRKIAEFESQNKNLQDQLQILNSRVALMESQMNQLVQTLTQQYQGGASTQPPGANNQQFSLQPPPPQSLPPQVQSAEQAGPPPHVPYNVQAIIPGRAWLRSSNGDTVTVAEGDEIKGVGRVTKIDPYDGIVVLDVHGRSVSLSYGNSN